MTDSPKNDVSVAADEKKIPKAVIKRLSLYSRMLQELEHKNITKISSKELSDLLGMNPAKVRKDLAYFGQFGVPGLGYYVSELKAQIKRILRTDREIRVALIGVGHLGQALLAYGGFLRQSFRVVAAFDTSPDKIGRTFNGVKVMSTEHLEDQIRTLGADIVVLAIPAENAQATVDQVVRAGIRAILNFVPARIVCPEAIKVHYVDLGIELESLSYYLKD
ncbi:redox-sensing transcriptional repressor Rex [Candidatus Sumerlaeota bacterium]|nr:redox-sensing transcriptional repressor Rex [Candidatus Sumerlaeota bacterium]